MLQCSGELVDMSMLILAAAAVRTAAALAPQRLVAPQRRGLVRLLSTANVQDAPAPKRKRRVGAPLPSSSDDDEAAPKKPKAPGPLPDGWAATWARAGVGRSRTGPLRRAVFQNDRGDRRLPPPRLRGGSGRAALTFARAPRAGCDARLRLLLQRRHGRELLGAARGVSLLNPLHRAA